MFWLTLKLILALGAVLTLYWMGSSVVRMFVSVPPPEEQPEVHAVDLRFECIVCGSLVTMTAAPDAEPQAPRHCMEEMRLIADHSSG